MSLPLVSIFFQHTTIDYSRKKMKSGVSFYLPGFILLTMPEFLIPTGVVSTDTALEFCVAIMMIVLENHESEKTY
jgi:hypothetical protein